MLGAGTVFVFWVIAARFYSAEDVGLASAIVSAMSIGMLSVLGLDLALIGFMQENLLIFLNWYTIFRQVEIF